MADQLAKNFPVECIRSYDLYNFLRLRPPWLCENLARSQRHTVVLPPGYAGRLETVFRPLMRARIASSVHRLRARSDATPYLVCAYPYALPWIGSLNSRPKIVYYNFDDYALYNPRKRKQTLLLEDRLIRISDWLFARRGLC